MSRLILLAGPAGVGKSTVERMIREHEPLVRSLGMADPIKQFLKDVFLFSNDVLYGPSEKRSEPDPRWSSESFWKDCSFRVNCIYGCEWLARLGDNADGDFSQTTRERLEKLSQWLYGERVFALQNHRLTCRRLAQTLGTEFAREVFGPDVWVNLAISELAAQGANLRVITDGRFENEVAAVRLRGGKVWLIRGGKSKDPGPDAHASERWIFNAPLEFFDQVIENPIVWEGLEPLRIKVGNALDSP